MKMGDMGQALKITGTGLGVVFVVMAVIALVTWTLGRAFTYFEARAKAKSETKGSETGSTASESSGGKEGAR